MPTDDSKLRNHLEKIYLKKQRVYGPTTEANSILSNSQTELPVAGKKGKPTHGTSIAVE